jgi:hypothetical protein
MKLEYGDAIYRLWNMVEEDEASKIVQVKIVPVEFSGAGRNCYATHH